MVQMILRSIPLLVYVAFMAWLLTSEQETQEAKMYWLQRKIHWHRARAEYHHKNIIRLEAEYKEVTL